MSEQYYLISAWGNPWVSEGYIEMASIVCAETEEEAVADFNGDYTGFPNINCIQLSLNNIELLASQVKNAIESHKFDIDK